MPSDAQDPPPPPPLISLQELMIWGEAHKGAVSAAHLEAICREEQPTLALARIDIVEHWLRLVSKPNLRVLKVRVSISTDN